jgi:hypothetical protein
MRKQRAKDRLRRLTKSPAKVKKSQVRSSPVRQQQQQQQQRQQQPNSASRKREQLAQKNENDADLAMASPLVVLHRSPNKNNTHQRSEQRSEQRLDSRSEQHDDLADSGIVNSQANNAFDILGQVSNSKRKRASRIWKAL